jgi:hypothetical protein
MHLLQSEQQYLAGRATSRELEAEARWLDITLVGITDGPTMSQKAGTVRHSEARNTVKLWIFQSYWSLMLRNGGPG